MDDYEIAKKGGEKMYETDAALGVLGISVEVTDPGRAEATFEVRPDMLNGHACNTYNRVTVASGASIDFLRPAKLGDTIVATATETHRGGRIGFYDVLLKNQDGQDIADFRGRSHSTNKVLLDQ
jgi:acyl-CoA thioesterase